MRFGVRWQAFRVLTVLATCGAGAAMVSQPWPVSAATGDHAFTGLQRWVAGLREGVITGDFQPVTHVPEPPGPPRPLPPL